MQEILLLLGKGDVGSANLNNLVYDLLQILQTILQRLSIFLSNGVIDLEYLINTHNDEHAQFLTK